VNSLGRRSFLIGSGALALAACGSSATKSGAPSGTSGTGASSGTIPKPPADGYTLAQRFSQDVIVPGTPRLPFSLASKQALLSDGPPVLNGKILAADHKTVVVPAISAKLRRVTEGIMYYDFHPTLNDIGTYYLVVDGGTADGGAISVNDPGSVFVPYPGKQLPPFDTPTTKDPRGVNPICTRLTGGPCPFHDVTLTDALKSGKPVAYIVGTPAHCQFGTCAPGLEFLINAAKRIGDKIVFVHSEVYTDDKAVTPTAAVEAYNLTFEPSLFLADKTGLIKARLDAAFDQSELDETLATLS